MKTSLTLLVANLLTLGSLTAHATKIVGNGGDPCEDRIKLIRDDIQSWIQNGGADGLDLPATLTNAVYSSKMQTALTAAVISCTDDKIEVSRPNSATSAQVPASQNSDPSSANEKVCANFTYQNGKPQILCNRDAFLKTNESTQYVLIHHEYAGLAGFEVNDGDGSNYKISNQISEFLQDQVVKKLGIKKAAPVTPSPACQLAMKGQNEGLKMIEAKVQIGLATVGDLDHVRINYQWLSYKCKAMSREEFCKSTLPLATEYSGIIEAQYQVGISSSEDLLNAQNLNAQVELECNL